ncbi:hypothetical protein FTUN_1374 [Frigoriglobus tundricola]|uniref:Uncharacterized protein n=1 Tax=Frigoriglobus tundricola TaxID=2774151 RepID=A0A6M5YLJ5_9BACT|nr:hypothetical protein FTUN_1374 [Frigoriglobus tundricola]
MCSARGAARDATEPPRHIRRRITTAHGSSGPLSEPPPSNDRDRYDAEAHSLRELFCSLPVVFNLSPSPLGTAPVAVRTICSSVQQVRSTPI